MNINQIQDPIKKNNTFNCYLNDAIPLKYKILREQDPIERSRLMEHLRLLDGYYGIPSDMSVLPSD